MENGHQKRQCSIWKKLLIIGGWLMVWQIACRIIDNPIFFAGPVEVLKELFHMAGSRGFMLSAINSLIRITGGFCIAFVLACVLAEAAYHSRLLEEILSPFVTFIKAVPVASVVVLLLIWFGAGYLSLYVTFMVVFPNIYINVLTGLKDTDKELLEMAEIFRFSFWKKLLYVYRPAVMPYLLSGAKVSVGMSFKSGVAAEIIGLPAASIGEGLYNAKIYLNTAGVFVWTVVLIAMSSLIEWLVVWLLKQAARQDKAVIKRKKNMKKESADRGQKSIAIKDVLVVFDENKTLHYDSMSFSNDRIQCVMGPSGGGKTTLLRVMAGLQETKAGSVLYHMETEEGGGSDQTARAGKIGMAFQEDRLCMQLSALNNVLLAADESYSTEEIRGLLEEILPKEALKQPAEQLSGGMKRRLAVARAVLSDADYLFLDEPFAGLDEDNHERLCRWIMKNRTDRLLIITTHDEEDPIHMEASVIRL